MNSVRDPSVFYTFALKWSPDFKEYNVHGLWPEVELGSGGPWGLTGGRLTGIRLS